MSTLERLIACVNTSDIAGITIVINNAAESDDVDTMDSIVRRGFIHAIRLRKYSVFIAMWNCYLPAYDPLGIAHLLKPIIDDQFISTKLASTEGCDQFISTKLASTEGCDQFTSTELASTEGCDQFTSTKLASTEGCDPADDAAIALKIIQDSGILNEYFTSYPEVLEMLSDYY